MKSLARYYRRRNAKMLRYIKVWFVMALLWITANLIVLAVNAIV